MTPGTIVERWVELFTYDESSPSCLRWREDRAQMKAGDVAGYLDGKGYYRVMVAGRSLKAHGIVFEMLVGEIPYELSIDHIDRDPSNNRVANLRLVTHRQNHRNRRDNADHPGVRRNSNGWQVQVCFADGSARAYFYDHALAVQQARVWHWLADEHPGATVAMAKALAIETE